MTEREEIQKLEAALALIREVEAARLGDGMVYRAMAKASRPLDARIRYLKVFPQNREAST